MNSATFSLKKANRFLPHILIVGIGIATANSLLNDTLNWIQWCLQSIVTSFIIGYTLVAMGVNRGWLKQRIASQWVRYAVLFIIFLIAGILATEVEQLIRALVFQKAPYLPISAGNMYWFNGIISLILGFSFFQNYYFFRNRPQSLEQPAPGKEPITSVPVKQGDNIFLVPAEDIAYFEAFDNYSFLFDLKGNKRLCDYSLLFLETRLSKNFSRVHRKYIINANHIQQIKPHINGRYLISFESTKLSPISTSKSHAATIRKLIKIE